MGSRRAAFTTLSTGERVATRDRDGQFVFPSYGAFNDVVDAAWHGEAYLDDRGRQHDGDAFLAMLGNARWVFEDTTR